MRNIHKVMGKNRGIADRAAVQRLALDKRWKWHWAREDGICHACGKPGVNLLHPIRNCTEETTVGERNLLAFKAKVLIDEARKCFRPVLEELWRNMEAGPGGEYACCGLYTQAFVRNLTRADVLLGKEEKSEVDKMLKGIGRCTRELLRKHGEIGRLGRVIARSVQSSILSFVSRTASAPEQAKAGRRRRVSRASRKPSSTPKKGIKGGSAEGCKLSPRDIFDRYITVCEDTQGNTNWEWGG